MPAPPLDPAALRELALSYVGRFGTTRAKLRQYLVRKLRERGWEGDDAPDVAALTERMAELGLIDEQAFAEAKVRSMGRRGLGARRVSGALGAAGVEETVRADALEGLDGAAAAEAYARRRRLGCYRADGPGDRVQAQKDMGAMLRAGHSFAAAKAALGGGAEDD
jgi:regulatory protein